MCIDAREALGWWTIDPLALGVVGSTSALYTVGLRRLRGHGIRRWEAALFYAGELTLLVALVSPVDRLSDILFSAHMTQHELMMVVAPPLIVLGRPVVALGRLLPPRLTRVAARPWHPALTVLLHAIAIWLWHVPQLFEAALRSEAVHAVQHAMFFGTAALFWWSILRGRLGRAGYGLATLFVFATAMHTSILGALLTVAGQVWYPLYIARGMPWAVDALDDQVLAGLVMWVPTGVLTALIALALFAMWLGEAGRRVRLAERRRAS